MILGFDYSHNNPSIDFVKAAGHGFQFAIGKASEGLTFTDKKFKERAKACRDAGMIPGAYHFFRPEDNPKDQAHFFLSHWDITQPMIIAGDFEWVAEGEAREPWDDFPAELRGEMVQTFLDEIIVNVGRKPMIYGCKAFLDQYLTAVPVGYYGGLWLADYLPDLPNGFENETIWQFTEKGAAMGVDGPVDLDKTELSLDQLKALAGY